VSIDKAFNVTSEVAINHRELGAEVWEWSADQQAAFLVGFAKSFSTDAGRGLFQLHYIAEELSQNDGDIAAVRWLNDRLTEYLSDPA
jgi:hypothetical protein